MLITHHQHLYIFQKSLFNPVFTRDLGLLNHNLICLAVLSMKVTNPKFLLLFLSYFTAQQQFWEL